MYSLACAVGALNEAQPQPSSLAIVFSPLFRIVSASQRNILGMSRWIDFVAFALRGVKEDIEEVRNEALKSGFVAVGTSGGHINPNI